MATRISIDELRGREYWRPGEAARVLGRGVDFWRLAFDEKRVDGYTERTRGKTVRYLDAASCRALLLSKRVATVDASRLDLRRMMDRFAEDCRASGI